MWYEHIYPHEVPESLEFFLVAFTMIHTFSGVPGPFLSANASVPLSHLSPPGALLRTKTLTVNSTLSLTNASSNVISNVNSNANSNVNSNVNSVVGSTVDSNVKPNVIASADRHAIALTTSTLTL